MPQMMPIYWFLICLLVSLFFHALFSFFFFNLLFLSEISPCAGKSLSSDSDLSKWSFLK